MSGLRARPCGARPARSLLLITTLAALLEAIVAAGCASSAGSSAVAEPAPIVTASDQSDIDRRARVRLELASAYFSRGQLSTALDEVKLSIAADPKRADAYNLRGLVYAAMGEDRLAADSFRRALEIDPHDGATLHNDGWFQCQRGRFAEAQEKFATALALPNYRDVARTELARGVCYGRSQQWPLAEAALMRAYELDPSNPSTGFNLAEVLYRMKAFDRARFYIGRVIDTPEAANAQTLWLATRIEHSLGSSSGVQRFGEQLRGRFPQSSQALLYERGRYDE